MAGARAIERIPSLIDPVTIKDASHPKNLCEKSDGLLDTHVVWKDIEKVVIKQLKTSARFGKDKHIRELGHANGFLSKTAICSPNWQNISQEEKQSLPDEILIKLGTCLGISSMAEVSGEAFAMDEKMVAGMENMVKNMTNAEVAFYENLEMVRSSPDSPRVISSLQVPRCYGGLPFDLHSGLSAFVAMQYFQDAAVHHIYHNVSDAQLSQILRGVARFQAASMLTPLGHIAELRAHDPWALMYGDSVMSRDMAKDMYKMVRTMGQSTDVLVEELLHKFDDIFDFNLPSKIHKQIGCPQVLCHGDLWSTNILWKSEDDDADLLSIIDWQMAHYGSPAEDLIRVLNCVISGKKRQAEWEDILDEFYGYLQAELEEGEVPYTREQLKRNWRELYPMATMVFVPPLAPIFAISSQDNEKGALRKEVIVEKINAMIEDTIFFHTHTL